MHSGCFPVDSNGFIVNTASVDKIQPVFRSLVGAVVKGVSNRLQSDLLTLFLRGSVSSGRAFLGTSDLDIVVVTKSVPATDVLDWNKTFAETLQSQMPVVSLIDLRLIQHQVLLEDRSYARLRVYLSTESVLLAGENIQLPKFKPNQELALYMHSDLEREITELIHIFEESEPRAFFGISRSFGFWCVFTMRFLLRASHLLVTASHGCYESDLRFCMIKVGDHYTELAPLVDTAYQWALAPCSDNYEIMEFMRHFLEVFMPLWEKSVMRVD